jgi:hypothetical protein
LYLKRTGTRKTTWWDSVVGAAILASAFRE